MIFGFCYLFLQNKTYRQFEDYHFYPRVEVSSFCQNRVFLLTWRIFSGKPFTLTVQVVDLEQEYELLVGRLPGEVVHRVDELRHGDGAVAVAVKDAEGALDEEGLRNHKNGISIGRHIHRFDIMFKISSN